MSNMLVATAGEMHLECEACGACGHMTRETGPVEPRAVEWLASHLLPRIVAVRVIDTATGTDIGWWWTW